MGWVGCVTRDYCTRCELRVRQNIVYGAEVGVNVGVGGCERGARVFA